MVRPLNPWINSTFSRAENLSSCMWTIDHGPHENSGHQGWAGLPCLVTFHMYYHKSIPGKQGEALSLEVTETLPYVPLPLVSFNLYPLAAINCNHEYNSFQRVFKPF